ncbi:hypothetical protein MVEN_01417700 [Mycena venus]|uniref:DUF6699 domain-containing protein n=1 Tax=Mycena venus TaxID=2733690 RepID=A0A8H6XWR0_9AGAR|nr:hypothetical protein MVEN_01417700 [Mycena venus]
MRGRVRFSSHNTFHSPPPPPLMSPASSSTDSSLGPLTPPPLPYAGLPGPTPFAPQYSYHSAKPSGRAHNLVAFSNTPLLNYDITLHPSNISTHFMGLSSAGFLEPAVYPPELSITLTTPHLPWSIVVPASNRRYVTVGDVLNAVYSALRVNVTPAEYSALGTQKLKGQATAAYRRRYERLRGHRGYTQEKQQGMKRVDFLMGYNKFQGISPTSRSSNVWQLNIS